MMNCEYYHCQQQAVYEVKVIRKSGNSNTRIMCESHLKDLQTAAAWSDLPVTFEVTHLEITK